MAALDRARKASAEDLAWASSADAGKVLRQPPFPTTNVNIAGEAPVHLESLDAYLQVRVCFCVW